MTCRSVWIFGILMAAVLSVGCTTSTYGNGLQEISGTQDEYLLKIYIGGFSGGPAADSAADEEISKFMKEKDYARYEILSRRHNLVPSYFEYRVKFIDVRQETME